MQFGLDSEGIAYPRQETGAPEMHDPSLAGQQDWGPGARFLVMMAATVIVVAGLRAGAPILLPAALALFLAVLSLPIVFWLQKKGVPTILAVFVAVMVDVGILGMVILLASNSFADFQVRLPGYAQRFESLFESWVVQLRNWNIPVEEYLAEADPVDAGAIVDFVQGVLSRALVFLGNAFLVLLIMVFMLAEASVFPEKFRAILGDKDGDLSRFSKITGEVLEYLVIKTIVSLATGLSIGIFVWIMGLDFPILLGLIGFLFNYVPTIGSVLAAIPAVILALIQPDLGGLGPDLGGLGTALVVAVGYLTINIVFGNLIEPHLLGRRLGLSTLVVILSLIFWAWAWGPVGALLAVPLTMVVKIMLENTRDLRWAALLLDKEAPKAAPASAAAIDRDDGV